MIKIYSEHITNRLAYTLGLVSSGSKLSFETTSSKEDFIAFSGFKINYSLENLEGLHIEPSGLLFKNDILEQSISIGKWKGLTTLFSNESKEIPFDIFSAIFYLLSRYEEYLPHNKDQHGRYKANNSIAYKEGFLETPIVDQWIQKFNELLQSKDASLKLHKESFNYISTIDVDSAFAYLGKGLYRTIGGFGKDVLKGQFKNFGQRLATIFRTKQDPFDTYAEFDQLHEENSIESRFFFLLADYGPKDINLPHWSPRYRRLIRNVVKKTSVGIHPGYVSNFYPEKLVKEIDRLAYISGEDITHSRQHYLILNWPDTYNQLIETGITDEYTMGYADQLGFRAGTSKAFPFFDLKANEEKPLQIHPFAVMDATLALYLNLTPNEAVKRIRTIIKSVQDVNGTFISCWHNESLSETIHWTGWSKVYREMISSFK